jgi:hypothetical protein
MKLIIIDETRLPDPPTDESVSFPEKCAFENGFYACLQAILNSAIPIEKLLNEFIGWMESKAPEGDVDGMTMFHLKDIPTVIEQYLQEQIGDSK